MHFAPEACLQRRASHQGFSGGDWSSRGRCNSVGLRGHRALKIQRTWGSSCPEWKTGSLLLSCLQQSYTKGCLQRGALHICLHGGEERVTQGRRMGAQAAPPITELTSPSQGGRCTAHAGLHSVSPTHWAPTTCWPRATGQDHRETAGEEEQGVCKQIVKLTSVYTL